MLSSLLERGKPDAFRRRVDGTYRDVSSLEFVTAAAELFVGLGTLGLQPGDRVAILSETRLQRALSDLAILAAGGIVVPIYPTLLETAVGYAVKDSGAGILIASTAEQAVKARAAGPDSLTIIAMEPGSAVPGVMTLDEIRDRGRAAPSSEARDLAAFRRRAERVRPEDLATIIYTSGTTGDPKGVMLTHANITSNVLASMEVLALTPGDACLAVLPLSHILERMAGYYTMLHAGATIAYAESFQTVARDMQDVRPTVMVCVPRLLEKVHARAVEKAAAGGPVTRAIFDWSRSVGVRSVRRTLAGQSPGPFLSLAHRIADLLVFSKLRARTGGRLRFFVSGGAPLSIEIAEFFHAAGLPVLEGYGLTESSPVIAVSRLDRPRFGSVGQAIPGVEIRIAPDGEILARGPNIMSGYWNRPDATAEALQDGWLHTGDIGVLAPDGYLRITDRKKDLIVTAGGKKVAPQAIENRLAADPLISTAVVLGDRRPYLIALIVPDFAALERRARDLGLPVANRSELVARPEMHDLIAERIRLAQGDAASYETLKRFLLLDHDLDVEHNQLTPTLKVKRRVMAQQFAAEIESLYAGDPAHAPAET